MVTTPKKAITWGLRALALVLGGGVIAKATLMTFGAKWHIHNDTGRSLTLACDSDDQRSLRSIELPPNGVIDYSWDDSSFGEALGASLGRWSCRAGTPDALAEVGTFSAESREEVDLGLAEEGGELVLHKASQRSPLARGGEAAAHERATN